MSVNPETAEWLDGPGLVDWLEAQGFDLGEGTIGHFARRVYAWRRGVRANVFTVDAVLCKFGLHLRNLPDRLWTDPPSREVTRRVPPETKDEIVRRVIEQRQPVEQVAAEVGFSSRTVRKYARAAA